MGRRCDLCGEELATGEWLAVRYACLTSCFPVLPGDHLRSAHGDFYAVASKVAKSATYSSGAMLTAAAVALLTGRAELALLLLTGSASALLIGTLYRVKLLASYRRGRAAESGSTTSGP
ncbi:MAG: hypothetical protein ABDH63_02330 [Candidatus Caldarchaeales archaeon]